MWSSSHSYQPTCPEEVKITCVAFMGDQLARMMLLRMIARNISGSTGIWFVSQKDFSSLQRAVEATYEKQLCLPRQPRTTGMYPSRERYPSAARMYPRKKRKREARHPGTAPMPPKRQRTRKPRPAAGVQEHQEICKENYPTRELPQKPLKACDISLYGGGRNFWLNCSCELLGDDTVSEEDNSFGYHPPVCDSDSSTQDDGKAATGQTIDGVKKSSESDSWSWSQRR